MSQSGGLANIKDRYIDRNFDIKRNLSEYFPWVLLVIFYLGAGMIYPSLLSEGQLSQLLIQSTPVILLGIGLGFVLITAEFDLSIVGVLSFAPLVGIHAVNNWGVPPVLGIVIILAVGVAIGYFNGVVVTKLGIPSLILTLASWWILVGAVLSVTGGRTLAKFPDLYRTLGIESIGPLRYVVIVALLFAIIAWFFSTRVRAGRRLYLVGGDPEASKRMGINNDRQKIYAFMISGLFASIAGLLLVSRVGSLSSGTGSELLMPAIAAPVIAGVSLFGGTGKIINIVAGALLVRGILIVTRVAGVSGTEFQLVQGILVLIIIVLMEGRFREIIFGDRVTG